MLSNYCLTVFFPCLQERANQIQSELNELVKSLNEQCKRYGLRAKPTTLVELPFGMCYYRVYILLHILCLRVTKWSFSDWFCFLVQIIILPWFSVSGMNKIGWMLVHFPEYHNIYVKQCNLKCP
jgi:hypothetical protein